jgi:hypothetical protein
MSDDETKPESTTPAPEEAEAKPAAQGMTPLVDHLVERRPEVRKRLLVWSGIFVVVFALFLLVANIEDLRMFDPVFLPSLFFLVFITLIYGYIVGTARGLRYCLSWSKKKQNRSGD